MIKTKCSIKLPAVILSELQKLGDDAVDRFAYTYARLLEGGVPRKNEEEKALRTGEKIIGLRLISNNERDNPNLRPESTPDRVVLHYNKAFFGLPIPIFAGRHNNQGERYDVYERFLNNLHKGNRFLDSGVMRNQIKSSGARLELELNLSRVNPAHLEVLNDIFALQELGPVARPAAQIQNENTRLSTGNLSQKFTPTAARTDYASHNSAVPLAPTLRANFKGSASGNDNENSTTHRTRPQLSLRTSEARYG